MTADALVIGVDVGGTKVSVATLERGRTGEPLIHPTDTSGSDALISQIAEQVGEVLAGRTAAAVGIGIPSVVDFATGTAKTSVNVPLRDVPLRAVLGERLGVPVFVDNDATVAAFAEAHDEHGQIDVRSLFMFTVGTGVGGGIVIDGRCYRGATGAAGEAGTRSSRSTPRSPRRPRFPSRGRWNRCRRGTCSTTSRARRRPRTPIRSSAACWSPTALSPGPTRSPPPAPATKSRSSASPRSGAASGSVSPT